MWLGKSIDDMWLSSQLVRGKHLLHSRPWGSAASLKPRVRWRFVHHPWTWKPSSWKHSKTWIDDEVHPSVPQRAPEDRLGIRQFDRRMEKATNDTDFRKGCVLGLLKTHSISSIQKRFQLDFGEGISKAIRPHVEQSRCYSMIARISMEIDENVAIYK